MRKKWVKMRQPSSALSYSIEVQASNVLVFFGGLTFSLPCTPPAETSAAPAPWGTGLPSRARMGCKSIYRADGHGVDGPQEMERN